MDIFKIFASLGLTGQAEFNKGLQDAEAQGRKTSTTLDTAFKKIGSTIAAAFSVHAIISFTQKMVEASATVAARGAQFEATFKEVGTSASEMFSRVSQATSIMSTRLQSVGTKAFSQLKGAGLDAADALAETERYLNLAADAAAYYDISLEDADMRLRSFIRGNVEAGDMIGLFTSETQRNTAAMEAYGKAYIECTEAQKQMIMLGIADEIYQQSGAIGQAQREGDAWENTVGNLKESWLQFLGTIGQPVIEKMIPVVQSLTGFLSNLRGTSTDLNVALGELSAATDTYRKAQTDAAGSTDALTLAMVQQRKEAQRSSFVGFAESISESNEKIEEYKKNLEDAGTTLKTTLDITRRTGAKNLLLAEFGIDIDAQSADEVNSLYSRLDEFRKLYNSGAGSEPGRTYLKALIDDLEAAGDEVEDYRDALNTLTTETERTFKNQEAAFKGFADLLSGGGISYTDLIGEVDGSLLEVFKTIEDGTKRGSEMVENGFLDTIPKTEEAYRSFADELIASMDRIQEENGYTDEGYWSTYAVLNALKEAAAECGIALEDVLPAETDIQTSTDTMEKYRQKLVSISTLEKALGSSYDGNAERLSVYNAMLRTLVDEGYDENSAAVRSVVNEIRKLQEAIGDAGEGSVTFADKFRSAMMSVTSVFSTVTSYASDFFSSLFDLQSQNNERQQEAIDAELEALEEKYEKERDMAEDAHEKESEELLAYLSNGDLTQQQYIEKKKALDDSYEASKKASLDEEALAEEELTKKKDELARKAFDAQKAQQIAQVWIQSATAIMTSMAQLGWPLGLAAIPVITATAGLQAKAISDQEYTPLLAEGGIIDRPMHVIAGEAGPEAIVPLKNNTEWTTAVADVLRPEIAEVRGADDSLIEEIRSLRRMLSDVLGKILRKDSTVVLDSGELVGAIAAPIDQRLGTIQRRRMRR